MKTSPISTGSKTRMTNHTQTQSVRPQPTARTQSATTPAQPPQAMSPKLIGSIVAVGSLAFIGILTETVMNVLFPRLMAMLSVNASTIQWLTTGYLLVVSVTVPLSSFLDRRFPHRGIFVVAVLASVAGCMIMIVGNGFPILLCARMLQGIGTGLALPLMFNIILEQAPQPKIGMLMGIGTLVVGTAPALGPAFGGFVAAHTSWRMIFVILLPIMAAALALGLATIIQSHPTGATPFATAQFVMLAVGFTGLIVFINQGAETIDALHDAQQTTMQAALTALGLVCAVGTSEYRLATQSGARIDYLIMAITVTIIGVMLARALRHADTQS
ncbi:MFS transporter [Bifidobacterium sp. 82T24]|uniref:MFS transporter n=1 Tax=Bifidobacterium pluvialisilvae TaxID=2834436 RepID=UPI001C55D343|nr:MFS transporter [Bifidobacterium pluvialisilvae]MBW3089038.1 MFS transporter [Bifidobacterium pluvialisilvae]